MRQFYSAARVAFWVLLAAVLAKSGIAQESITNYVITSSTRLTVTVWQYTYSAAMQNTGIALSSATATLTTTVPNITVVPGKNVLTFGPVPSSATVQAKNTFTINVDRTVPFTLADLIWTFQNNPPVANAGPNQTATVGTTVHLNGSASTNPSGVGTLTYNWMFTSLPPASTTTLVNPTSVTPTFFTDVEGTYVVQLTVSNGKSSAIATVTISGDIPPVANAGLDQSVALGTQVTLNGSQSSDSNGAVLTYSWQFLSIPANSAAVLSGANTVNPTFTVDQPGNYVVQLTVNDGLENSAPDNVTISQTSAPVANAGTNQTNVGVGNPVQLNGSKSTDADGDPLTYLWSLITLPSKSVATLSNTTIVNPTFIPDVAGTYVAQLIVFDGTTPSIASTVTINTGTNIQAPTANAGLPQKLVIGTPVTLNGSGSSDPQGLPLTYSWSFTTLPTGSKAVLSTINPVEPTFVPDVTGTYVVQLIVNNGTLSSAASTVTIAIDTPPVANPGSAQNVSVGTSVVLSGSGSSDADGETLNYSWSLTSWPGSTAPTLSGANTVAPTFTPTVAGIYVVQLIVSDALASSSPQTVQITAAGPSVITLSPNPMTIATSLGNGTLTVSLASPAGSSGQVVNLVSSNKSAATVPATATVPANASSVNVAVSPVANGTTTITASASGFTSGTATVTVATATATITLASPSVGVAGEITGTVTLSIPAPAATTAAPNAVPTGNVTVSPTSVPVAAGSTTASFTITGVTQGTTATIGVNVPGYSNVGAVVTVIKAPLITVPSTLSIQAGQPAVNLSISLQTAAPAGGVTVTLASADTKNVTVTPSVFIAGGATTPATMPTVTGLVMTSPISISAVAPGYASGVTNVTVTAGPPASITAGGTPQSVAINTPFSALTATVTDSLGDPVSGAIVTFTAPATAGAPGVTVATTPATTNTSGVATVTLTSNATVGGPYTVTAKTNGVSANYSLTNLSGPPKTIALAATNSGSGQSASILTAFTNPLKAVVTDAGGNPLANVQVTFSAPTGTTPSGTFAGGLTTAPATTDSTGTATSPIFTANGSISPSGSTYNVTVTVSSNTSLSAKFSLTNLAGPPTQIAATAGSGQSAVIGAGFTTQLQATVKDAGGNLASGVPVTFTASTGNVPSATFTGGVSTITVNTTSSGVAPVSITANNVVGTYTVTATFPGNAGQPVSFSLTNNPGAPASITATAGATQSAQINTAFATNLQATVKDAGGNLVTSGTVLFTITAATGGASGKFGTATTYSAPITNGVATASTLTANLTVGGPFTVTATVSGVATGATFSLTNTPGAPSTIATSTGTPQNVQGGLSPVTALSVVVKDVGGNVLPNQTVTFSAPITGASGTFGGQPTTTAITNSSGIATAPPLIANYTLGAYTVTATINSLTASFSLTNIAGVPATITASPTTAGVSINTAFPSLSATVRDAGGNLVANTPVTPVTFTVTPASNGASVTTATSTVNTTNGVASVNLTANGTKGGPYTLTATTPGATSATFSLTNNPGPATSITAVAGTNNQATQNSTAFPTQLAVTVTDAAADLLSGVPVTFTIVAGAGGQSGTFAPSVTTSIQNTNASGVATAPILTANGKLGVFTVTATTPGASGTISLSPVFSLTNQSGPPATASSLVGSGQSQTVNVAFTTALSATLKDAGGNLAVGYPVTFTIGTTNGATGAFSTGAVAHFTSITGGIVNAPAITAGTVAGTYTVTMTVDANPSVSATYTLTNNPGSASKITPTAGTPQNVTVGGGLGTPLTATVTDQYGNNVLNGTTVTFTVSTASGAASGKWGSVTAVSAPTTSGVVTAPSTTPFAANTVTGAYTVTASVSGATSGVFNLTNIAGPAATITATAASITQSQNAGLAFGVPLAAVVKDAYGNLVTGQPVVFTAPTGTSVPSGTFTGGVTTITVNTDGTGTAQAPFTANGFASVTAYSVTATINGHTATFTLTNKPGLAANITAVTGTTPQTGQLTQPFPTLLAVNVTDVNNNPVSGAVVTFTVVAANGATGAFSGSATATATTTAAGLATAPFALTATAGLGTFTVTATTPGASGTLAMTPPFSLTNVGGPPAKITAVSGGGQNAHILTAFTSPLVVSATDTFGNPATGSITFTAPTGGASFTFPNTTNTTTKPLIGGVATSAVMTANKTANTSTTTNGVTTWATYNVTATSGTVSLATPFTLTNTPGAPANIVATAGTPQSAAAGEPFATPLTVTVTDAGGNLIGGANVTFSAPTSGYSGYFGAPQTLTVTTNSAGVATAPFVANLLTGGPYTVTATVPNVTPASFSLTNTACSSCKALTVGAASVGQFLQTTTNVALPALASGTVQITITSSDPTKVLIAGASNQTGTASLTIPFTQGSLTEGITIQGVSNGSSGTAYLIASAPGYVFGEATVTLTPSGFVLVTNANNTTQLGGNVVTNSGDATNMALFAYQLDSSLNPLGPQALAGGVTANVTIQNTNTSVGTITPASPITITGPSDPNNGTPVTFNADPSNTGTTTLTVAASGFSTPATGTSMVVTVNSSQLSYVQGAATIGQSLETSGAVLLSGMPGVNVPVTIVSSNPSQLLVSTSPTAAGTICTVSTTQNPCVVGQNAITVTIGANFKQSPTFYLQNVSTSATGTATITITAPGYQTLTKTVTLAASAIIIYPPFGEGAPLQTTSLSAPSLITIETDVLDASNTPQGAQMVAGGLTVTANVTIVNSTIGTITGSPATLTGGQSQLGAESGLPTAAFQPNTSNSTGGSTTINVAEPTGFSTPSEYQSISVVVNEAKISLSGATTIGKGLQGSESVILGAPAPAGGLQVTISSANNSLLTVAANPGDTGTPSVVINLPAGATNVPFYLQGHGTSGTVSYTVSAPGFVSKSGSVALANSGVIVAGPLSVGNPAQESVSAGPDSTWAVYTVYLDSSDNYLGLEPPATGTTVTANVASTQPTYGTVPATTLTVSPTIGASLSYPSAANLTTGVLTVTNAPFQEGQQVAISCSGTCPTELTGPLYVVVQDANDFCLASTTANATAGTCITGLDTESSETITVTGAGQGFVNFTFTPVKTGNTNVTVTSSFGVANNQTGEYFNSIPVQVIP